MKHPRNGHTVEGMELNKESTMAKLSYAMWVSSVSIKSQLLNPSKQDLEELSVQWRSERVPGSDPSNKSIFWVFFWSNNRCTCQLKQDIWYF